MPQVPNVNKEVCPNCGDFVTQLFPVTGWCYPCSKDVILGEGELCPRCNRRELDSPTNKICRYCRQEKFLEKNADAIDRELVKDRRITVAIKSVKEANLITCLSCGDKMRKSIRGTNYFCTKRAECRTAQNKLHRLLYVKKVPREEALREVLEGINAENNRTNAQAEM